MFMGKLFQKLSVYKHKSAFAQCARFDCKCQVSILFLHKPHFGMFLFNKNLRKYYQSEVLCVKYVCYALNNLCKCFDIFKLKVNNYFNAV